MKTGAKRSPQAAGETVPNRLPNYLTTFVGRAGDLDGLTSMLRRSRMITLTGPGGAGKSRLAAELGKACVELWPGGLWWVELAPVEDPSQMPGAIVAALELPGPGQAHDVVTAWLAPRRALLVLDNCEHLIVACAEFCQEALQRCSQLTIIATSREPLGVAGEARWPVSSLEVPYARELFEARAQLALPDFENVAWNEKTVSEICERLDRLPLAIELAAARVGLMSEQEILSQLSDRFRLLTGGTRTAPMRLQAMSTAIDWSYRLLTEEEAALFRRLSVFRGGFTLDSARAVCADGITAGVLDLVAGLVQKSMVVAERSEGSGSRYRLLESQLAYAEDRLREAGELETTRRRHYEHFKDPNSAKWHSRWVADERSNLSAAMSWARQGNDVGLGLATGLGRAALGDLTQLRTLLEELLDSSPGGGVERMGALNSIAHATNKQGDYDATIRFAEAGLALARSLGNLEGAADALNWVGSAYQGRGELDAAAEKFEEALSLVVGSNNYRLVNLIRGSMADLAVQTGDYTGAHEIMSECIATASAKGDLLDTAIGLERLAWAQRGLNDHRAAAASWKEALAKMRTVLAEAQLGIIDCIEGLSMAAEARADDRRAIRLAAAANRTAREKSYNIDPWWSKHYEDSHSRSRARLGPHASQEAWNEGWSMTVDQVVGYALAGGETETVIAVGRLSRRQKEVAQLVAGGMTNREIAGRLFISERTAEGHVEQIRSKLGVRSRTEVAAWVVEHRLAAGPKARNSTT